MLKSPILAAFGAIALLALPLQALPDDDRDDFHKRDWRWERHDHSRALAKPAIEPHDSQVELPKADQSTTVPPAAQKMGNDNADIAVALAKASLAKHGIHNPTPEQLQAALNGGTVTTKSGQRVTLPGVLKLRASGMGWGGIAQKVGVKVGDVKGHGHAHKKDDGKHHHKHVKHHKHEGKHERKHEHVKHQHHRPDFHRAKFERPERPQRPEKIDRPHRPERPERPERHRHRH